MNAWIYGRYSQLLTFLGDVMVATEPPKTGAIQILDMMSMIQPGDVVCRKYTYYLDSILIPGEYSHSGFVISQDLMAHSIAEGVLYIHPIDFVKDTDGFIICRPKYKSIGDTYRAVERAVWHVDNKTQYDFLFEDASRFYCHEFTVDCLERGGIEIPMTDKKFGIWPFSFTRKLYLAGNIMQYTGTIYEF